MFFLFIIELSSEKTAGDQAGFLDNPRNGTFFAFFYSLSIDSLFMVEFAWLIVGL